MGTAYPIPRARTVSGMKSETEQVVAPSLRHNCRWAEEGLGSRAAAGPPPGPREARPPPSPQEAGRWWGGWTASSMGTRQLGPKPCCPLPGTSLTCVWLTWEDLVPVDTDIAVPIGPRVLVPEAQNVHELMKDNAPALLETGGCQGDHLHPSTAPHTREAPAGR